MATQGSNSFRAEAAKRRLQSHVGKRFGRWVVEGTSYKPSRPRLACLCDCGTRREVCAYQIESGGSTSCGCYLRQVATTINWKHGLEGSPEHTCWRGMKARCYQPNQIGFDRYGGRGITVCERWRDSFAAFLEDMGPRPSKRHTVDRINNDGNYEPGNCRWATKEEQGRNRHNNRLFTIDGRTQCLTSWCEEFGILVRTVVSRIDRGIQEDRLFLPINKNYSKRHRNLESGEAAPKELTSADVAWMT